jgi:Spy/CpxP family protein refolding chaperone
MFIIKTPIMKIYKITSLLFLVIIIVGAIIWQRQFSTTQKNEPPNANDETSAIHSPYAGQELRGIKTLSQDDIEGLLAGTGTPFGGMAKPAELNGYPGLRHVLDAVEAVELKISDKQKQQIEKLYQEMKAEAIKLGQQIIGLEKEIDDAFSNKNVTEELLKEKITQSAELYGQLRVVHLKYHLSMVDILTQQQIDEYNELRGYTSGDPCENIPSEHDPEMWKLHNNC